MVQRGDGTVLTVPDSLKPECWYTPDPSMLRWLRKPPWLKRPKLVWSNSS